MRRVKITLRICPTQKTQVINLFLNQKEKSGSDILGENYKTAFYNAKSLLDPLQNCRSTATLVCFYHLFWNILVYRNMIYFHSPFSLAKAYLVKDNFELSNMVLKYQYIRSTCLHV